MEGNRLDILLQVWVGNFGFPAPRKAENGLFTYHIAGFHTEGGGGGGNIPPSRSFPPKAIEKLCAVFRNRTKFRD